MVKLPPVLKSVPIERATYAPYGDVIAADESLPFTYANMRTAKRFNHLSDVKNLRPESAKLNLCVFRCQPARAPLEVRLLERHRYSTQVFLPMAQTARFLVVVSLGGDTPALETLKAFVVEGARGISYRPGVWHYPMTALDNPLDFSCLIWEDNSEGDCQIVNLDKPIRVEL